MCPGRHWKTDGVFNQLEKRSKILEKRGDLSRISRATTRRAVGLHSPDLPWRPMDSGALADLKYQSGEKVEVLCTPVCASNSSSSVCNVQCAMLSWGCTNNVEILQGPPRKVNTIDATFRLPLWGSFSLQHPFWSFLSLIPPLLDSRAHLLIVSTHTQLGSPSFCDSPLSYPHGSLYYCLYLYYTLPFLDAISSRPTQNYHASSSVIPSDSSELVGLDNCSSLWRDRGCFAK